MADKDDSKNGSSDHEERGEGAIKEDKDLYPLKKKVPAKHSVLDTIPPPDDAPKPKE